MGETRSPIYGADVLLYVRYSPLESDRWTGLAEGYQHSYFTPRDEPGYLLKQVALGRATIHTPSLVTLSGMGPSRTFGLLLSIYDAGATVRFLAPSELANEMIIPFQWHRKALSIERAMEIDSGLRRKAGRPQLGITLGAVEELAARGLSQGKIAERLGCSERQIQRLKKGLVTKL